MRRLILSAVLPFFLLSCGSDSVEPDPVTFSLAINGGDAQTAVAGELVGTAPSVRVTNNSGATVSGVSVTFEVVTGGGTITGGSQTTDANGVATIGSWALGTVAGANSLRATASSSQSSAVIAPVTFTATGIAGPADQLGAQAGNGGTGVAGAAADPAPSVLALDANGNPASGLDVTFAVTGGGGAVTGAEQTTGANGIATVGSWTLGAVPGVNTLVATPGGAGAEGEVFVVEPVTFTVTGVVGPPASLEKTAGDGQSALVNTAVAVNPQVKVTDAGGNAVENTTVDFSVATGGGAVTGGTQMTDANGFATVGSWTLGGTPGENTLMVEVTGVAPVTFTATATAVAPANIAINAGDNQAAIAGNAVPINPSVLVTDQGGAPVSGVAVDFTVTGGGGVVAVAQGEDPATVEVVTNQAGIATVASWTLGAVGANTMTATAAGAGINGNPVTFNATGAFDPTNFNGMWSGNWNNTTFASTGTVTATFTATPNGTPPGGTIAATVDFNGGVLGGGDPAPEMYGGTYGQGGLTVTDPTSPTWGNLTVTITPDGQVTGTALNPAPGITRVDFTGSVTPTTFSVNYTVTFTGGFQAVGTWTMTKN